MGHHLDLLIMSGFLTSLHAGKFFVIFCPLLIFFQKNLFQKFFLEILSRVSNSLDPDRARQNVGPDLDQNCLQRLSAVKS